MRHSIGKTGLFALVTIAVMGTFSTTALAATTPMIVGQVGDVSYLAESSTEEPIEYESSDSKVVSVSKSGVIKAKKAGSATVSVEQGENEASAKFKVYAQDKTKASKPAAVAKLKAGQTGDTAVTLNWSKVKKADGYVVYQRQGDAYAPVKIVSGYTNTSFSLDGLNQNTVQDFVVSSYKKVTVKYSIKTKKTVVDKKTKKKKTVTVVTKTSEKRLAVSDKSPYATVLVASAESTAANVGSITFGRNQVTMVRKGSASILAVLHSSVEGLPVCDEKLRYSTSNAKVATVTEDGTVQSHSKVAAQCTVTAVAHNGVSATIGVRVLPNLTQNDIAFVAHRGDRSAAPENTMASAALAAINGYKEMEFDVWETFSGDLVVLHDQNMQRMYGVDKDIRELVTGDITSPDYYGNYKIAAGSNLEQYKGLTVPTFEEMVRLASGFGIEINVHVKNDGDDPLSEQGLQKMLTILNLYNMQGKAAIATQDKGTLAVLGTQDVYPYQYVLQTSAGFDITGPDYMNEFKRAIDYAAEAGCKRISIRYRSAAPFDASLIDYCHEKGLSVSTWDVTSNKKACAMIDMGVDSITLDKKLFV